MTLDYLLRLQNQFSGPLKQARDEQGRFMAQTKQMGSNGSRDVGNLSSAFGGLALKIGAAFTAWKAGEAVFSGFKKSLGLAADAETTAVAFKTLVGSAELANDVLGKVKKLADTTPFEFPELAGAARMLVAFGESAKEVPETLRRIGDVASGVASPSPAATTATSKARTQGQLFAEDINQLTGRGIPIIKELAKVLGQPESAIKKLGEEGKITFPLIDQAFRNMTSAGGQFYKMMEEQSGTTNGLLSTLQDGVNSLFLEFGKPLNDAIKPILTDAIAMADDLKPSIEAIGRAMGGAMTAVHQFVTEAQAGSGLAEKMGSALWEAFVKAGEALLIPLKALWAGVKTFSSGMWDGLKPIFAWVGEQLMAAADNFVGILQKGIAAVLREVPGMGKAADKVESAGLDSQNSAANRGVKARGIVEGYKGKDIGQLMEESMAAMRGEFEKLTKPAANPYALPPSALDSPQGPSSDLFPGGALPAGAKGGKANLPGSGLYAPASIFDKKPEPVSFKESTGAASSSGSKAEGIDKATADANAKKPNAHDAQAANKEAQQKKALDYEDKELKLLKARQSGNTALADAMERQLKILREADAIQSKTGVGGKEALSRAQQKVSLGPMQQLIHDGSGRNAGGAPGGTATAGRSKGGYDANGVRDDGAHKITGVKNSKMMGGGIDEFNRMQKRDGTAATAFGGHGLSGPRPNPKVPSPGTAKAAQSRRETAASQARETSGGSNHPLAGAVKDIAQKLGTLALAK